MIDVPLYIRAFFCSNACVLPSCRNEYLIFQKIIKLEYDFPEKFFPRAKDLVEKLLVIYFPLGTMSVVFESVAGVNWLLFIHIIYQSVNLCSA